jgi:flagellar biosynthetic protein FliO
MVALVLISVATASVARAQATQPAGPTVTQTNLIHRSSATAAAPASPAGDSSGTRVILSLAAVLGLIALMYWGSRWLLPTAGAAGRATQAVQVLSRTHISPKQKILLIQVGGRVLVVGDNGQQLNTLCEIGDAEEAASLVTQIRGADHVTLPATPDPVARPEDDAREPDQLTTTQHELDGLVQRVRRIATQLDRA